MVFGKRKKIDEEKLKEWVDKSLKEGSDMEEIKETLNKKYNKKKVAIFLENYEPKKEEIEEKEEKMDEQDIIERIGKFFDKEGLDIQSKYFLTKKMNEEYWEEILSEEEEEDEDLLGELGEEEPRPTEPEDDIAAPKKIKRKKITVKRPKLTTKEEKKEETPKESTREEPEDELI